MEFVTEFCHKTRLWWKSVTIFRRNFPFSRIIVTDLCHKLRRPQRFRHNLWRTPSQLPLSVTNFPTSITMLTPCLAKLWWTSPSQFLSQPPSQIGRYNVCHKTLVTEGGLSQKVHHNLLSRKPFLHNCDRPITIRIVTNKIVTDCFPSQFPSQYVLFRQNLRFFPSQMATFPIV